MREAILPDVKRYNVTVKDLFDGMERASGVLRQFGMGARGQAGMLTALVSATGATGAEAGNAVKFIGQRIMKSDTVKALRKEFDVDLTTPTGDLKNLEEVLDILAAKFTTLNSAQRAQFLELTAGSRQAAKFAVILENNTTRLLSQAQAALETNSAYSENQLILQSLEARLNSCKAAWTDLFVTMGDKGAYDAVAGFLNNVKHAVEGIRMGIAALGGGNKGGGVWSRMSFMQRAKISWACVFLLPWYMRTHRFVPHEEPAATRTHHPNGRHHPHGARPPLRHPHRPRRTPLSQPPASRGRSQRHRIHSPRGGSRGSGAHCRL